ncbi:Guanine nucleotide-binding protein negative regulator 1 [Halotydeus destructor]|nr:Guanine nucleotide-binding protein negative regulator 1 [Halotydeus destructor]
MEDERENTSDPQPPPLYELHFEDDLAPISDIRKEFSVNSNTETNYLKGCKWSPDGLCLLTCSQDNVLRLFETKNFTEDELDPAAILKMKEAELIYDYCWYPEMDSIKPETCALLCTSRYAPIHLRDAYDGRIRATYRAYNNVDEVESAYSVSFNHDGTKIYAGFKQKFRIFDTSVPGRCYFEQPTLINKQGQSGILSCIAFNKAHSDMFAIGSYSKQICIYDADGQLVCIFEGHNGGITHMVFSPDGNRLYSGGRKDSDIICWDTRNFGKVLQVMQRDVKTNQRMYFDVHESGEYLASGNDDGTVSIWKLSTNIDDNESILEPLNRFQAHGDCVNGFSFHPTSSFYSATSSGKRMFPELNEDDDEPFVRKSLPDNSVKIWLTKITHLEQSQDMTSPETVTEDT